MAYISFQPSDYFNTKLYTGNGSTQSITGVGFQPDWVWFKIRNTTGDHRVFDVVRGTEARLYPNGTQAEASPDTGTLTSFDSDGFSVGNSDVNINGSSQVAWNWRASGTSGSSNSDGSITSTVSASTTSGFSIVKWTGTGSAATVGHGLGVAPKWIIMKNLDDASGHWWVYHSSTGEGNRLLLNLTNASGANTDFVNNTAPTTSVFSVKNESNNTSGNDIIAYCFAEKKGFSKFGSYTGNGNADGTFVYTGFKPAFVMIKSSSLAGESWFMQDNKRSPFNVVNDYLLANSSNAEATTDIFDLTSNGFKIRNSGSGHNSSGATYIYMCFAEEPLVSSNNIPATAR
jgi:hypothetical protein